MDTEVSWMLSSQLQTTEPEQFEGLLVEMVKAVQTLQNGTTAYVWYLSEDGLSCEIFATFKDSDAALLHLNWLANSYGQVFSSVMRPTAMTVYGKPSKNLRDALTPFAPRYVQTVGGFAR